MTKCQFRLNAEEQIRQGKMDFLECGQEATRAIVAPDPLTNEVITIDLCSEHFEFMAKEIAEGR